MRKTLLANVMSTKYVVSLKLCIKQMTDQSSK